MKRLKDYSVAELRQLISLKEQIEVLQNQLQAFGDESGAELATNSEQKGRRRMSASARRKIGLAQKARWAKKKGAETNGPMPKKRRMSRAGRARIAAAAKSRWAKIRAEKNASTAA